MPGSEQERMQVAKDFYCIAKFLRVIGAIDCTHMKMNSPGGTTCEQYRNRETKCSLNVQMASDAKLKIRNIIARWPGSAHDSTVFNDLPLCAQFVCREFGSYLLIGDAEYPCRNYLLTPLHVSDVQIEEILRRLEADEISEDDCESERDDLDFYPTRKELLQVLEDVETRNDGDG
nr:putative nuclease HARBI1 [Plodia interpunctella]